MNRRLNMTTRPASLEIRDNGDRGDMNAVQVENIGKVTVIKMGLEQRMNALEKPLRDALKAALIGFGSDAGSHVAVLTGAGKAFCAGGSLNELGAGLTAPDGVDYMQDLNEIIRIINNLEKPVIAAVNGAAVGAGFSIALACDMVIASENAIFSVAFARVGLVPDLGGIYFLPRIVGLHKAKELYFTGETLNGRRAFEMGLINHVVAPDELTAFTMEMATRISLGPPRAFALGKSLLNRSLQLTLEDMLFCEAMAQSICFQSDDHSEGIKAFREKRAPEFSGN